MGFTSDEDFASTMIQPGNPLKTGFTSEKDYGAPTNDANLNIAKGKSKLSSFGTGIGYGTKQLKNALEEAYLKFVGTDREREDLQKEIANEKDIYGRITSEWNPNAGYLKGGNTAAQVGFGMAVPTPQSKTMGARALINGLIGGGYEGLTTTGSLGDRVGAAGVGAVGAGAGSVGMDLIAKRLGSWLGKSTQPEAIARRDAMVRKGFKPRIGDVADPHTAPLLKSGENLLADTTLGATKFTDDIAGIERMIVPDRATGVNALTSIGKETEKGVRAASNAMWGPFEQAIQGNVTKVRPAGLHESLNKILVEYPQVFNQTNIPNQVTRDKLLAIASMDPKKLESIPIAEYHELRKALGSITASVKINATPIAAGSPAPLDKKAVGMVRDLYRKSSEDIDRWGRNGSNQKAHQLFSKANEEYKAVILPWEENTIAKGLKEGPEKFGTKETAQLVSNGDRLEANEVRDLIKKFGPYGEADAIDVLTGMSRQGQGVAGHDPILSGLDITRGALASPLAMMSRKKAVQDVYFGDPMLGSSAMNTARRAGIGYGREQGDVPLVGTLAIYDMLFGGAKEGDRNSDEPGVNMPISSANQMGTR
jgi:hypothetical protein